MEKIKVGDVVRVTIPLSDHHGQLAIVRQTVAYIPFYVVQLLSDPDTLWTYGSTSLEKVNDE